MRAGIVDIDVIADLDLGQVAVDGELVVVFAQAAGHIIGVVVQGVFLAQHSDVVVRAVHRRAHQVGRAGVQTRIFLVGVLLVDALGHQRTVGPEDEAAHLGVDGHIAHARGDEHLVKRAVHAFADRHDVARLLARAVGDAHAAGQVDERDVHAGLALHLDREVEQDARQRRIVLVCDRVGREEGVDAEMLDALGLHILERLNQLLAGHAVLGLLRGVHDLVVQHEVAARIEAAGHGLLPLADLVVEVQMRDIVKVDDCVQIGCQLVVRRRGHVGREHDLVPRDAAGAAHLQLGQARAVAAKALLVQDLEQARGGGRLDGEVFLEAGVPRKRGLYLARILADGLFVVDVERGRVGLYDFLHLRQGQKGFLFHWICSPFVLGIGVIRRTACRGCARNGGAYRLQCAGSRSGRCL